MEWGPALALIWIEGPSIRWTWRARWDESARIINNHSQPLGTTLALGRLSKDKKTHICLHIHPKALSEKAKAKTVSNRIFSSKLFPFKGYSNFQKPMFSGYEWPTYKNMEIRSLSKISTSQICVCSVQ